METLSNILADVGSDVVSHTIKVDGTEVSKEYRPSSITINQMLNHIPYAHIVLIDGGAAEQDFPASNSDLFLPGKEIELFLGNASDEDLVFKGIIHTQKLRIRQDGSSHIIIKARDAAFRMSIGVKRRYFTDTSDTDILEEIIQEYGLRANVAASDYAHPGMVQFHASDWDFLITRTEMNGWVCKAINGEISLAPPDFDAEPAFSVAYGREVLELDLEMDGRNQYQAVRALAWITQRQEVIEIEGQEPGLQEAGNLSNTEIADGIQIPQFDLLHSGQVDAEELQSWADATLLKTRLAKITGRARFFGTSRITPGQTVVIEGVGDRFNGQLYVCGVQHTLTEGVWVMDLQFGLSPTWYSENFDTSYPRASGLVPAVPGLQIGVVTQIEDDPDGEDRVQVRLPIIDGADQGIWARVSAFDAGVERGCIF